jgi:hypothetical protein
MALWFSGKGQPFKRSLGQVDCDDPTNLPPGCATVCRNTEFTRDNGGVTSGCTRAGINLAIQGPNKAAITGLEGFVHQPQTALDAYFERPIGFDEAGTLFYEFPLGSGRGVAFPATPGGLSLPAGAHMLGASASNRYYAGFSDLKIPLSPPAAIDPGALTVWPLGMKPFGWHWQPNIAVRAGEVCTPATPPSGNGHTYQALNSGRTGLNSPAFAPVNEVEGQTYNDNGVIWKELTMVLANRLPTPPAPVLTLVNGGGTFPAGQTVCVYLTLTNGMGETTAGAMASITTTDANQGVNAAMPAAPAIGNPLPGWLTQLVSPYAITGVNVYEADVASGNPLPSQTAYEQASAGEALGGNYTIPATAASAVTAPALTTARITPGQLPIPDTMPDIQRFPAGSTVNPPGAPGLSLVNGAGLFPHGQTVYILLTLTNAAGETTPGALANITTTIDGQGVQVSLASNYGPTVTGVKVYSRGVNEGSPIPDTTLFGLVGSYALGASPIVTETGPSGPPPTANTATLPTGTFPAGRDIYFRQTYTNGAGETPAGPASAIINTNSNDAVMVTVAVPQDENNVDLYTIASVGIYEADVPTGGSAPLPGAFALVGYYQPTDTPFILNSATGPNPHASNTTGPGGNIAMDTTTGGIGGSQGYRYGVPVFINQNQYFSGFTVAAISSCTVDEDGWELAAFNILTGPANTIGRAVSFAVADGTVDGPFDWIGRVNILATEQNWVYPQTQLSGTVTETATLILDNVTTSATFNFDDTYLMDSNDVTDRLQLMAPPEAVRVDYLDTAGVLALTGALGYTNGGVLSIPGELESFRGDTGPLPIVNNGEACYGFTDKFKGGLMAICSGSGWSVTPNTASPSSWRATRRWGGEGPGGGHGACGPKAWAACAKFIIFVDVTGIYKYEEGDDDLMSKEVPRMWSQINWLAKKTIEVYIDENTKQVLVSVPTGASTTPNMVIFLSYLEGWQNPLHFSTFMQNEITMEAARRYSFNDISANVIRRVKRTLPLGPAYVNGPAWDTMPDSSFGVTQLLYGSSAADGTVQARTPGIYNDNGEGIDWRYRTSSAGWMQAVAKPEGFNLNATGMGRISAAFYGARDRDDGAGGKSNAVPVDDFVLTPDQHVGITRKTPGTSPADEYWSVEFTNYKMPDAWCSLKTMMIYGQPITQGRGETEAGQAR